MPSSTIVRRHKPTCGTDTQSLQGPRWPWATPRPRFSTTSITISATIPSARLSPRLGITRPWPPAIPTLRATSQAEAGTWWYCSTRATKTRRGRPPSTIMWTGGDMPSWPPRQILRTWPPHSAPLIRGTTINRLSPRRCRARSGTGCPTRSTYLTLVGGPGRPVSRPRPGNRSGRSSMAMAASSSATVAARSSTASWRIPPPIRPRGSSWPRTRSPRP